MMKRRILMFSGFFILALSLCFTTHAQAGRYLVKKGDNLYTISKKLGISVTDIKKDNQLAGDKLKPGQVLSVNVGETDSPVRTKSKSLSASYTIKKGDTLSTISKKTGVSTRQLAALNNVSPRNLRVGRKLLLSEPQLKTNTDEEELLDEEDDEATPETEGNIACEEKDSEAFLGKWGSADERKLFVRVATGFLGAPYRLGGATVKGIDCSAFVRKMYSFFDIQLPRTAREQSTVGVRVDRNDLVEGDLVFFRTRKPIGHVGIYIGNNEFVHASYKSKAVRVDNLDQPYFQKRFQRAVRVKGLEENGGT